MSRLKRELEEAHQQNNELQVLLMAACQRVGGEIRVSTQLVGGMIEAATEGRVQLNMRTEEHEVTISLVSGQATEA